MSDIMLEAQGPAEDAGEGIFGCLLVVAAVVVMTGALITLSGWAVRWWLL